ncbi:MAG: alpha/beta fold hydrolase [Pseudomonadota bacterium]
MPRHPLFLIRPATIAGLAVFAILVALWQMVSASGDVIGTRSVLGTTPITVYRAANPADPAPAVVIAHGFAGSRQLMGAYARTLARSGYVAVSFDFRGHGRNRAPLTASVIERDDATQSLLAELERVVAHARALPGATGEVALLGHSMASDIIVRKAAADPDIAATVAISMFSQAVSAEAPENLLMIPGAYEGGLTAEAIRVLRLAAGPRAEPGVTYGSFQTGTARRVAIAPGVEHVGVLFSQTALREALVWLNHVFDRDMAGELDARGPWISLLILGVVMLGWPLSYLLPAVAAQPRGSGLRGWRLFGVAAVPAFATPLLLHLVEVDFLPVVVGDYLTVHFALYGALTAAGLWLTGAARPRLENPLALLAAAALMLLWTLGALGLAIDTLFTSFIPVGTRWVLVAAMICGTIPYFLADEWLTRGTTAPLGAYALTKGFFLLSLAIAVVLDLRALFFLIMIVPLMLIFFVIYGLFSRWANRSTRHPFAGGLANAVAFAYAIAVTFPLLGN